MDIKKIDISNVIVMSQTNNMDEYDLHDNASELADKTGLPVIFYYPAWRRYMIAMPKEEANDTEQ